MIDYTDIDARLEEYSNAFDFYIECGKMPPAISPDDCLALYMQEVIDSNPQLDGSDPLWVEVLKEDIISFFSAMLEQFRTMQLEAMKELELIERFSAATIERKRQMWPQVKEVVERGYSRFEINLEGYTAQFQTEEKEAVFTALTADWQSACQAKLDHLQRLTLERSRPQFELICREAGARDYEDRKKVESYIHRYPQLKEIVDIIGRDKKTTTDEKDTIIYKFMPVSVAKNASVEEIDRIVAGDNLERVLPVEFSMPEELFFKRYATKELQQFSSPGKDKPKKTEQHRKDPRLTKGPIIVAIDTSGSMADQPLKIAFSLLKQLLRIAKRQKRPCYLISFSVRVKAIDFARPRNWRKLDSFLENSFSGGTCGEQMLAEALRVLHSDTYEMADVLIISDLQFAAPVKSTLAAIDREKSLGTRFYALQIGKDRHDYAKVLDRIWVM